MQSQAILDTTARVVDRAIEKSWRDASSFEERADRGQIVGVSDPVVMRPSEFMVRVILQLHGSMVTGVIA